MGNKNPESSKRGGKGGKKEQWWRSRSLSIPQKQERITEQKKTHTHQKSSQTKWHRQCHTTSLNGRVTNNSGQTFKALPATTHSLHLLAASSPFLFLEALIHSTTTFWVSSINKEVMLGLNCFCPPSQCSFLPHGMWFILTASWVLLSSSWLSFICQSSKLHRPLDILREYLPHKSFFSSNISLILLSWPFPRYFGKTWALCPLYCSSNIYNISSVTSYGLKTLVLTELIFPSPL